MKKGCLITLALFVALVFVIGAVWFYFWNECNPAYHGKRVNAWAHQAIWNEDPAARREAVQVLMEALKDMRGQPRTQLLMRFCHPEGENGEKWPLPKEVLPFLIEALKLKDGPDEGYAANYAAIALYLGAVPGTVSALEEAFQNESDPEAKERIWRVLEGLRQMKPELPNIPAT